MQVELLRVVVVAEVGAVVGQVVLQAGPRGGGVAAAVRNAVQQVAAVHVAPDTTGSRRRGDRNKGKRRRQWVEMKYIAYSHVKLPDSRFNKQLAAARKELHLY